MQQIVVYESDSVSAPCPSASDDDRVTWFHKTRPILDHVDRAKLLIGSANVSLFSNVYASIAYCYNIQKCAKFLGR